MPPMALRQPISANQLGGASTPRQALPRRLWAQGPSLPSLPSSLATCSPQPAIAACNGHTRASPDWHPRGPCMHSKLMCRATSSDQENPQGEEGNSQLLYTLAMGTLWLAVSAYAFTLSPNQTPYRDQIFLRLLVGLRDPGEDFMVNQVYSALFNVMGVWPCVFGALLVPGGRSANKLPAWPFVTMSFGLGVFALLPYFTFWRPIRDQQLPPPKEELEGWNRLFMKGAETPVLPALLMAATLFQFYLAATAGPAAWADYGKLIDESRLVHVTTLDFLCLTAFAPFWMYNDAEGRKWEQRDTLLPLLSALPVVGPITYLLLRPKTKMD